MRSALLLAFTLGGGALAVAAPLRAQDYSSPVGCEGCINYWYYVDHGDTTDYTCGETTYSGHTGTDYSLRGGNDAIDDGNEIVAAASGIVIVSSDGNYDRCTSCGGDGCGVNTPGGGFSNYVVLDHGTHRTTYGHMRSGSVAVSEGERVECGQVLGHIGSAGCSSGAHLHFEPRLSSGGYGESLDPYEGECSSTEESLWTSQGPYRGVPGSTCASAPPECPADTNETWTCSEDGTSRRRCIDGTDSSEACPWSCRVAAIGDEDECDLPPDADGDGSRVDTDCDDRDQAIHPAAVEVCGDGIDQDCSGADLSCGSGPGGGVGGNGVGGSGVGGSGGMNIPAASGGDGAGGLGSGGGAATAGSGGSGEAAGPSAPEAAGGCACSVQSMLQSGRNRIFWPLLFGFLLMVARRKKPFASSQRG